MTRLPPAARSAMELLSSMRFAISLLTVISVASVIGTVLKQNEPYANYLNQFGPFWFPLFGRLGLYSVYNAWWFLLILAFLVGSTSLCVWRNAPIMLREVGRFRENLRERAFDNFPMRATFGAAREGGAAARVQALTAYLGSKGFTWRTAPSGESTLIAAKAGMYRRVGYVFAHVAIVMICVGGLADSEVSTRMAVLSGAKQPVSGSMRIADVPAESRLSPSNWSFRGNLLVPEGQSGNAAVLNLGDGVLVQDLPFTISLKRFQIEHYSTGQPKLFASDVIVTDRDTGESFESRIEVNKPLIHKGIAVYQSGFDDGGTLLRLTMRNLLGGARPLRELEVRVGESFSLDVADAKYTMELTGFRPINVENVGDAASAAAQAEPRGMFESLAKGLGSAAPPADRKRDLRNVGPSYQYKLRDAAGQAREYSNYMLPLPIDGRWYLMTGVREQPADPFRYLRLPLDEAGGMDEYVRLRSVLLDGSLYAEVGRRFASAGSAQHQSGGGGAPALSETMRTRLAESAARVLETFSVRGYQSVAAFLEQQVPEGERDKAAEIYIRILQGAAWEAWQLARERAGLPRLEPTPERGRFIQDGLNALSDTFFYGVPLYMQLASYEEVKASVFQLTRSPGKPIVYWGCALLVLGIFAMFYLRERRLWLLVHPDGVTRLAFTSNRRTLDVDEEFARHRNAIANLLSNDDQPGRSDPSRAAPPAGA